MVEKRNKNGIDKTGSSNLTTLIAGSSNDIVNVLEGPDQTTANLVKELEGCLGKMFEEDDLLQLRKIYELLSKLDPVTRSIFLDKMEEITLNRKKEQIFSKIDTYIFPFKNGSDVLRLNKSFNEHMSELDNDKISELKREYIDRLINILLTKNEEIWLNGFILLIRNQDKLDNSITDQQVEKMISSMKNIKINRVYALLELIQDQSRLNYRLSSENMDNLIKIILKNIGLSDGGLLAILVKNQSRYNYTLNSKQIDDIISTFIDISNFKTICELTTLIMRQPVD